MARCAFLLAVVMVAGCSALPRDPDGTSDKVRASRVIRVGVAPQVAQASAPRALIRRLEAKTGASARPSTGDAEPLLAALEKNRLDVVLAWFDPNTPWATRVALAPPIARRGEKGEGLELRAAMRNGENRWIMLVETEARALAPELAQ